MTKHAKHMKKPGIHPPKMPKMPPGKHMMDGKMMDKKPRKGK